MERGSGSAAADDRGGAARRSDRHRIAAIGDGSAAQRRPRVPAGDHGGRDARLEQASARPYGSPNAAGRQRPDRRQRQRQQDRQQGQGAGVYRSVDRTTGNAAQWPVDH